MSEPQELISTTTGEITTTPAPVASDGTHMAWLGGIQVPQKEVVVVAQQIADTLSDIIRKQHLYTQIGKKEHVHNEGWVACLAMIGLVPREEEVKHDGRGSYMATVGFYRQSDNVCVTRASAICGIDEPEWAKRPKFARRSMAITRASGKAARLAYAWIMVLAGYSPTPFEEMSLQQAERVRDDTPPRSDYPADIGAADIEGPPPDVYENPPQLPVDYEAQRPQPHRPPVAQRAVAMQQRATAPKADKQFSIARDGGGYASEKQIKLCWGKMKGNGVPQADVHAYLMNQGIANAAGKASFGAFRDKEQFDAFLQFLDDHKHAAENNQNMQQYPPAPATSGPAQGMPVDFDDDIPF